eukprot:355950-Chlamydomonas_euryale.AAC.4
MQNTHPTRPPCPLNALLCPLRAPCPHMFQIARGKGDCGIATDGNVAYVTDSSRKPGAERRILESVTKWK